MIDARLIVGIGIAVGVVVVLSALFDDEVRRASAPASHALAGSGQALTPAQTGTAMMMAQAPMINPVINPKFQNIAAPVGSANIRGNPNNPGNPPNFLPGNIQISEAHWQGMDVALLDAELRRKLRYPNGLLGIIVDEVTLNAARSGLKAGDIIVNVGNVRVTTLEEFQRSSRMVKSFSKAELTALRKGVMGENGRFVMRRVSVVLTGDPELGFAQLESAPMILAGDGRPHPYRGACTNCHSIGVGFELTPDPDMITLPPPQLTHATVTKGISPHRDRGPCEACHLIIR